VVAAIQKALAEGRLSRKTVQAALERVEGLRRRLEF
jgi:hypothetical protein